MLTPLLDPSLSALLADTTRYCIALLLLAAGMGKLRGYGDFRGNLATSFGVPPAAAKVAAPALVMAELLLAGWLLAGGTHIPMLLSLLLLTTLTAILAWRYFTRSVVRCSCFGEAARPVSRYDLLRNVLAVGINGAHFALAQETALPVATAALAAGLAAIVIYASMVTDTAGSISEFWNTWMRTMGSTDHIFEILRSHRPVSEAPPRPPLAGHIALRDVRFSYPERTQITALDGVSLTIRAGEKIALVGASGAGKSTIASLVLGHYQIDAGSLQFDGIDAHVLGVTQLRRQMAVVEQEPALFSGSIADNISFAVPDRQVTRDEILAAARLAHAHDFITAFPDGYETLVGERGVQLSGGQKQRIAIARAILRVPKILMLDEATSALDAASEQQVQQALDTLMQGRTTIIIAHRFSTIVKADRIIVMHKGRICQQSTHAELLRAGGQYARLMQQQLSQFQQLHASAATL